MKEDYLWDKTGEADPDVEQLEKALGRLRYKRPTKPLPLPVVRRPWQRFNSSLLAAAAAVLFLVMAAALWMALTPKRLEIVSGPPPNFGVVDPTGSFQTTTGIVKQPPEDKPTASAPPSVTKQRVIAERRQETAATLARKMRERELREEQLRVRGELAKEQLIKALQITSDKLGAVQKRIQGNEGHGPIS